jgi:hypothetical protein
MILHATRKKMIAVWVVVGILLVVGLMFLVGSLLPREHVASESRIFNASADKLFDLMISLQDESEVKTRVIEEVRPTKRVTEVIEEPGAAFGGTWTLVLEPIANDTRLTITENGRVYNPLFRFLSQFAFGHHATIRQFMKDLESRLIASSD